MGEQTLIDKIKSFIGHIGFSLFLWSINMTQDEYLDRIQDEYLDSIQEEYKL